MEDVGIFYADLVHFTAFCYMLWTFGIVRGNLVYFSPFWYFVPRKIWQPLSSACPVQAFSQGRGNQLAGGLFSPIEKAGAFRCRQAVRARTFQRARLAGFVEFERHLSWLRPGLPDGLFSNQKSTFG
jgi:hypothetical protein